MLPGPPNPRDPGGKGCLYSGPGRRDTFPGAQRASSIHFPQKGLPVLSAAATLSPVWADTELFAFLFYFISCSMVLPRCHQGPPSLCHQQSPAGKLPRDTLVVSSSVGMFPRFCLHQFQILPDKGLLYRRSHLLCYTISLCKTYFSSQGISKPQCAATQVGDQKESQLYPRIIVCFFSLSFFGGWVLGCCGLALPLPTVSGMCYGPLNVNDMIKSLGKFCSQRERTKRKFRKPPPESVSCSTSFFISSPASLP